MHATLPSLVASDFSPIWRRSADTFQAKLSVEGNQDCLPSHLAASLQRPQMMDGDSMPLLNDLLRAHRIATMKLVGGAPKPNLHAYDLARQARPPGVRASLGAARQPQRPGQQRHSPATIGIRTADGCAAGQGSRHGEARPTQTPAATEVAR